MQNFGFEKKEHYLRLFEAMESDEHEEEGDTIHSVMESIQGLIVASYFLGINPLRGLRQILPQYSWRYYWLQKEQHVKEVVGKSDFIWRIWHNDDAVQLVAATKLGRPEPLKYFWAEDWNKPSQITFVENFNGIPVYWN